MRLRPVPADEADDWCLWQAQDCRALLRACALGAGALPADLPDQVKAALHISDPVIRNSVAAPTGR